MHSRVLNNRVTTTKTWNPRAGMNRVYKGRKYEWSGCWRRGRKLALDPLEKWPTGEMTTQQETHPCVQTGSRLPGTVWRGLIFFTTDRPDYHRMPPPAGDNHGWVVFAVHYRLCVRSPCQHISRMRTFDNNSCAISITSPRSLFRPRTQHGRWGHREKSRRASTRWDCRGKSCLAGLSPLSGTPSERRDMGAKIELTHLSLY